MNNKSVLTILVLLLLVFGGAAVYLGFQLSQAPNQLPQTGEDPNTICDTVQQNNGFLFVCDAQGDGQLFSCQDRQYHGAGFAHACAVELKPGTTCSGLTNIGVGPWENDAAKRNLVGCNFTNPIPQNCFCPDYPNGAVICYDDTYGWGTTYDSCGARYLTPTPSVITTPPTTTPPTTTPPTTTPPTTTPPTTTPPTTTPPVTTLTTTPTDIPKTAILNDELDRIFIGALFFSMGLGILLTGQAVSLGKSLAFLFGGGVQKNWKAKQKIKQQEDFEEKFL